MPDLIPAKDGIFNRHPELTEINGFRLQLIPHSIRGRNDKKSEFSTFYEFIKFVIFECPLLPLFRF
jgi:hypothetical protein